MCDSNSNSINISGGHKQEAYNINLRFTRYDLRFKTEKANHKSKIVNRSTERSRRSLKFLLNFSGNNTNERISYRTGQRRYG